MASLEEQAAAYDELEVKANLLRTRAEARRQRILQSSSRRLDMVSGTVEEEAAAAAAPSTTTVDASTPPDEPATAVEAKDPPAAKPKSAGSARLQQMRRRRFKKAAEAKEKEDAAASSNGAVVVVAEEETKPVQETAPTTEAPAATTDATTTTNNARSTTAPVAAAAATLPEGDRKKYMGVARMRRKMLSERKLKEEQATESAVAEPISTTAAITDGATSAVLLRRQHRVSVLLQMLTTVMLLVAGIDIGWNHVLSPVNVKPDLAVLSGESKLVRLFYIPNNSEPGYDAFVGSNNEEYGTLMNRHYMNGRPLVDTVAATTTTATPIKTTAVLVDTHDEDVSVDAMDNEDVAVDAGDNNDVAVDAGDNDDVAVDAGDNDDVAVDAGEVEEDEFSSEPTKVAVEEEEFSSEHTTTVILDPIFGVDLDELTKGDGAVFAAARGAVEVHRFFTGTLLSYFGTYLCPPFMFLAALLLRRSMKMIGAGIPEPEDSSSKKGSSGLDIVDTVIKTVKGTIMGSVPSSLVLMYEVLRDSKRDMYIVLCGVLLGVAFPLYAAGNSSSNIALLLFGADADNNNAGSDGIITGDNAAATNEEL